MIIFCSVLHLCLDQPFHFLIYIFFSAGCITECGGGLSCLLPYNCTHFDQCHSTDAGCSCTRLMCSFGTFFSAASGVCDTVSKGLCDEGNHTKTYINANNDDDDHHDDDDDDGDVI